jgi:hypothetical protein
MIRRYRLVSLLRKCSIKAKAKETNTPSSPMLRYDYKAFSTELGARIRQIRKESGLTLRVLQLEHNYHLSQIQRIEKGDGISLPTLLRIAETFQVPLEKLIVGLGVVSPNAEAESKTSKK